jgi:competence protein ComEC
MAGIAVAGPGHPGWPWAPAALLGLALVLRGRPALALAAGAVVALVHQAADPVPSLLNAWARRGFEPGVTPVGLVGRVDESEWIDDGRVALTLRLERYALPGRPGVEAAAPKGVRARLTVPAPEDGRAPAWRPGDRIEVTARTGPPRSFRNPGGFDYAAYLRARGIGLTGAIKSARLLRVLPGPRARIAGLFPRARQAIVDSLRRASAGDDETASFLAAILVGERHDLAPGLERALRRAGVYHIIALSGLNVALVALLVSAALRLAGAPPAARRAIEALTVALYWGIARPGGSISRAALMALIYVGGAACGRRVSGVGAAGAAAIGILVLAPDWWRDAGFQLSFAAALAILLLLPALRDATTSRRTRSSSGAVLLDRLLLDPLRVSAAALLGTALLGARHFHALTPAALPANLFAVPLSGAILVQAVAIAGLEPLLPATARGLAWVAAGLVRSLEALSIAAASAPGASVFVLPPPAIVVAAGSAAAAVVGLARRGRAARAAGAAALALAALVVLMRGRAGAPAAGFEIVSLDVGQGDATLVRLPGGQSLLVDAGGLARSRLDVGDRVVAPALRSLGLLRLDLLAITHADRDHVGGAASVLEQMRPRAVWLGRMPAGDRDVEAVERAAASLGIPVVLPRRGVRLELGGCRLEVLNPGVGVAGPAANDDSLVLRVTCGERSALLTGDLESPLEGVLLREGRPLSADLLKVGHHGSRGSTSAPFLAAVAPAVAVISVGAVNPWGHPHGEVIERLTAAGATVYRTDRDGAVLFRTDGRRPWSALPLVPIGRRDPAPFRGRWATGE